MKVLRLVGLNVMMCLGLTGTFAQQVFKTTSVSTIAYLEYLPEDYNSNSNKYPVVIFLHGIGERGPNTTDTTVLSQYIQNVARHGPPQHVKNGTAFPFILISPQLKNNYSTWPSGYVKEVIDHCKTYLRIDQRRIIITGLSLGGGGTWVAAQDYPELFAAVAPVCGGYNSPSKACGIASENVPVWAFHGDKDTVVPLSKSQTMVNAINACVPAPSPLAMLTIYAGVGHNAWDYAYRTDNSLHTPNIYEWMMSFTNVANKGNKIPVANAGSDKSVTSRSFTLAGSASDADGSVVSYSWKKLNGPAATLANATSANLSLSNLQIGNYVFTLQVTDNSGDTDTDYVKVIVKNAAPDANAGSDREITLPVNSIVLTGTGLDTDGTITAYQWTQVSGAAATLANANTASLTASNLVAGSYTFQLKVTDNLGATGVDDVTLIVNPPTIPVVNAGSDKLVKLPTSSATMLGTASDPDGSIVSYQWTKISGSGCSMYNTTTSALKLSGMTSGVYKFRLSASDNQGHVGSDEVTVTVDAPPVVNAGADMTIALPLASPFTLAGTATDADGTIVKYQWSKYSGPSVTVSNATSPSLTVSKVYEGTYVFKLAVTDNLGVVGYDYVTLTVKDPSISTSGRIGSTADIYSKAGGLDAEESLSVTEEIETGIIIYNAAGERIYAGPWTKEKEDEVIRRSGLYFYNVIRNGQRVRSGKIIKKDI
jgi:dienelactone hydrolase